MVLISSGLAIIMTKSPSKTVTVIQGKVWDKFPNFTLNHTRRAGGGSIVRPEGLEPPHLAPEASALSD